MANFCFKTGDFGIGAKQGALRAMYAVARCEVRFAGSFETRFGLA